MWTGARSVRTTRPGARCSSATWSTAGPTRPGFLRLVMGMVAAGDALCVPGQPREQAPAGDAWAQGPGQPRAGRVTGPARGRVGGFRTEVEDVPGRSHQPLRARRRTARRLARRVDREVPRAGVGPGARVLPVRPDHRRDRRVRTAGAVSVGAGVPRPGHGALRPHARAVTRVDQQHPLPGHRLRVRWPPDRAALPGAGDRVGTRGRGLLRAGPPVPGQRHLDPNEIGSHGTASTGQRFRRGRAARGRCARHRRRDRHPGDRERLPEPHRGPGGERGRGARGDEPLRHRPAVADVPAADHEPGGHRHRGRTSSNTPTRRSRRSARSVSTRSCARRSTWVRARWRSSAAISTRPGLGSAHPATRSERCGPARAGRSSTPT